MYMPITRIENQRLENESLTFDAKQIVMLGPNLTLSHCRVVLSTTQSQFGIMALVHFEMCQIQAKRKLVNFQGWSNASLTGCTFCGHFSGNDFGGKEDTPYMVKNCDFSHSILAGCRFFHCVPETLVFPKWPCYVIVNPNEVAAGLRAQNVEGPLRRWAKLLGWDEGQLRLVVEHWPNVAKYLKVDEAEIKALLSEIPGVHL
jgi:hypothetical protein